MKELPKIPILQVTAYQDNGDPEVSLPPSEREQKAFSKVCDAMYKWSDAIKKEHGSDPDWDYKIEAIDTTFLMITKSALLWRLLYRGEPIRTEKCPKHNGRWSGLPSENNWCECGLTGWLPSEGKHTQPTWVDLPKK